MSNSKKNVPFTRALGSAVWKFFSSVKLTIGLLFTIAAVSILGTVVQQDRPVQDYLAEYGEKWTDIILTTGINDMYHTPWFTILLISLALNIIVCTFERFPPKWKSLLKVKPQMKPSVIDRLANKTSFTVDEDFDTVKGRVEASIKKKKFKFVSEDAEGGRIYHGWRGVIGRFGSDFTHISLLTILLGAVIGGTYGYKDFKVVTVGDTMTVPQADFKLRLDKFWIEYYDTGQIRQYNSLLSIMEDGKKVGEKQIWVNEPLLYKGIRFYQSSWGTSWKKLTAAEVAIRKKGEEALGERVRVGWNQTVKLPDSNYSVKLVGYVADFAFSNEMKRVFSKSMEPENPAIWVEIFDKNGERVARPWLFLKYPGMFESMPGSEDQLIFTNYKSILYSGISVNKDPGTNIVWIGACIMGLGSFFSFFVFHRKLWIFVNDSGGSTEVRIGAMINKNKMAIEKDIKDLEASIKGTDGKA